MGRRKGLLGEADARNLTFLGTVGGGHFTASARVEHMLISSHE